jgi:DNA topoisomerase-1
VAGLPQAPAVRSMPIVLDPVESARLAGLKYVRDTDPGIRRRRSGGGFTYTGPDGQIIHEPATIDRIRRLAVPAAYTDVWICPDPRGHIQATGFDARRRKQYRYHPKYREVRDQTKFSKMLPFSETLPRTRRRVDKDLALRGLPRPRVLAAAVRLLESTGIRIGNDEYARINHHFGLTTLRDEHVAIEGATLRFQFTGKHGKLYRCHVTDPRLATIVQRAQALPGEELFKYVDDSGVLRAIHSEDVNGYIRAISGQPFTAKDFRTWAATILAVEALRELEVPPTQRGIARAITRAIDQVSEQLNNTRTVCRKYYIHPAVLDAFADGELRDAVTSPRGPAPAVRGLDPFEEEVVALLRRWITQGGVIVDRIGGTARLTHGPAFSA